MVEAARSNQGFCKPPNILKALQPDSIRQPCAQAPGLWDLVLLSLEGLDCVILHRDQPPKTAKPVSVHYLIWAGDGGVQRNTTAQDRNHCAWLLHAYSHA